MTVLPFAERHALLVPDPGRCHPQFLGVDEHQLIWQITAQLGERIPGIGFGYNAYGAYASVNHLHFQMFDRSSGTYPIEAPAWRHNGGSRSYPLPVRRFDDADEAWAVVQELQTEYKKSVRDAYLEDLKASSGADSRRAPTLVSIQPRRSGVVYSRPRHLLAAVFRRYV